MIGEQGFDVFTNPGPTLGYRPITTYKRDKELEKKLIGLAKQALTEVNFLPVFVTLYLSLCYSNY